MHKINSILLIDDNKEDNFIHSRIIRKSNLVDQIIVKNYAEDALALINSNVSDDSNFPQIILVDINMPRMNGWEFLETLEKKFSTVHQKFLVCLLTTSENPDDLIKSQNHMLVSKFISKPLTLNNLIDVVDMYKQKSGCQCI